MERRLQTRRCRRSDAQDIAAGQQVSDPEIPVGVGGGGAHDVRWIRVIDQRALRENFNRGSDDSGTGGRAGAHRSDYAARNILSNRANDGSEVESFVDRISAQYEAPADVEIESHYRALLVELDRLVQLHLDP